MKILFFRETDLKELNPSIMSSQGLAGTENSLVCLAKELSKKHIVKVIAPQQKQQTFGKVEYIPYQSYAEVLIHHETFNPDIFIVVGNPSLLFQNSFSSKVIFWQQNHPRELEGRFDILYLVDKLTIVAPSPEASSYYNKFYNTDKIIGIYNGVRPEFFNQVRKPILGKITYCGAFMRSKGLHKVLLAAQQLPQYDFNLCGSFDLYGFIDEIYKHYCMKISAPNVKFTGNLPGPKLAEELATSCLCIVNPQIENNETCCISALESMCVGTPVLAGWSEILSSIVSNGGFICSKDLVLSIKEAMSFKGIFDNKQFTSNLSWDKISIQWEQLLCQLMKS